jgi:hypothetical protein
VQPWRRVHWCSVVTTSPYVYLFVSLMVWLLWLGSDLDIASALVSLYRWLGGLPDAVCQDSLPDACIVTSSCQCQVLWAFS